MVGNTLSSIQKINISNKELKYYKQWVEETQEKSVQEYVAEQIMRKLQTLKKQDGRCNQRSIFLQKGEYKGSCIWRENAYKVYVRTNEHSVHYGFFSSLYSAEMELTRLFEHNLSEIEGVARKQQKYYQLQHRLTTRPRLTDKTQHITYIRGGKTGVIFKFDKPFINPITKKPQKQITFGKWLFKHYSKKQILDECVEMDDPLEIFQYREDLKKRLKEHKTGGGSL